MRPRIEAIALIHQGERSVVLRPELNGNKKAATRKNRLAASMKLVQS
jgi:hypothetical protein